MKHVPYTEYEEQILLHRANQYLGSTGHVQWKKVPLMPNRDKKSMSNHWQVMKQRYRFDGKQWVTNQRNLFDGVTPQPKKVIAKKTPQNASTRKRVKESRGLKIKKSFLWGALTIERYE
jgi:hypothetical protein